MTGTLPIRPEFYDRRDVVPVVPISRDIGGRVRVYSVSFQVARFRILCGFVPRGIEFGAKAYQCAAERADVCC